MYDPNSLHAEEFINHDEILDTLAYSDAHKNDRALIQEILEKAKKRKGLSHREASVLLMCEDEDLNQEIFHLSRRIFTVTGLYYSHRYICQITVSTVVCTALIMRSTSIFRERN